MGLTGGSEAAALSHTCSKVLVCAMWIEWRIEMARKPQEEEFHLSSTLPHTRYTGGAAARAAVP